MTTGDLKVIEIGPVNKSSSLHSGGKEQVLSQVVLESAASDSFDDCSQQAIAAIGVAILLAGM